jgi:hypothetical protein
VAKPTPSQRRWLERAIAQPGGKLPLFDGDGQQISTRTVRACLGAGWAEPWRHNPIKPDWLICRITPQGRAAIGHALE